jgi:hypothetical protein
MRESFAEHWRNFWRNYSVETITVLFIVLVLSWRNATKQTVF